MTMPTVEQWGRKGVDYVAAAWHGATENSVGDWTIQRSTYKTDCDLFSNAVKSSPP